MAHYNQFFLLSFIGLLMRFLHICKKKYLEVINELKAFFLTKVAPKNMVKNSRMPLQLKPHRDLSVNY